jgi:hypothetical protein
MTLLETIRLLDAPYVVHVFMSDWWLLYRNPNSRLQMVNDVLRCKLTAGVFATLAAVPDPTEFVAAEVEIDAALAVVG